MNLTKEKRTAIVRFVKLSEDSTKYTMPITEVCCNVSNCSKNMSYRVGKDFRVKKSV